MFVLLLNFYLLLDSWYQFQLSMILLRQANINPHILLKLLRKDTSIAPEDIALKKIACLSSTRLFKELLHQASTLKGMNFPNLEKNLSKAAQDTLKQKKELKQDEIMSVIAHLDKLSRKSDDNSAEVDLGQANVFKYAKILFDEGNYLRAYEIIHELEGQLLKDDLWLKTTWAKLHCQIMLDKRSNTLETLRKKIDDIEADQVAEASSANKGKVMRKCYARKEQFLILSVLVFFQSATEENCEKFVDLCTADKSYFSVLQLTRPELLRYVCVALIINKPLQSNRPFDLYRLVEVINRKIVKYTDPFTEFLCSLYIDFDFEAAEGIINKIKKAATEDVLLRGLCDKIVESCQFLYYKVSCKIFESVSLHQIARFTGKSEEEAELWILKYIRSTDIDAKIDQINGIVSSNRNKHSNPEKYSEVIPNVSTLINSLSRAREHQ